MANNRNSFIAVPQDLSDTDSLRRFLSRLIEQLDVAFGHRGVSGFASDKTTIISFATLDTRLVVNTEDTAINLAGMATNLAAITVLEDNLDQLAIIDLAIAPVTPSASYVQTEAAQIATDVQTLQTGINTILARLRAANIIV